jgi:hypothetical protein
MFSARRVFVVLCIVALPVWITGQGTPTKPGGFTPFRDRAFGGTAEFGGAVLEQPGCPLRVSIDRIERNDRGITVGLRVENLTGESAARRVLGVWVLAADGTIRSYRHFEGKHSIPGGGSHSMDVTLRSTTLVRGDMVVVAVQESVGGRPWHEDQGSLEKAVRTVALR